MAIEKSGHTSQARLQGYYEGGGGNERRGFDTRESMEILVLLLHTRSKRWVTSHSSFL